MLCILTSFLFVNHVCRLKNLDLIDDARQKREAAKNKLEAFIYATRNKLSNDFEDVEVRTSHNFQQIA